MNEPWTRTRWAFRIGAAVLVSAALTYWLALLVGTGGLYISTMIWAWLAGW